MPNFDTRISVTKALCIILMVVGHSGCPTFLGEYIYQFHMPCFFFVSGFLLKEKYLSTMMTFFKRRIKGLWWPFVKWSVVFMLLHNVLTSLHIYNSSYTLTDLVYKLFHIVTMTGSEQLLGGYWFLKELFYASVISIIALKLLHTIPNRKEGKEFQNGIILTLIFLVLAYILSIVPFKIPTIGSKTMLATSFYIVGYTFHHANKQSNLLFGILSMVIVFVITSFFSGSMESTNISIFLYFIVAMIGTVGIINIAGFITGNALKVLNYVGSKTLYILTFHFISFKLVSLILIGYYDLPITRLSDFPVISGLNSFNWIIYSIIGVTVPLILLKTLNLKYYKLFNITNIQNK